MSDLHPDIAAVLSGERKWCVVTGDCLAVLPTLPPGSVDAVVTDPPYGMSYQSNRSEDGPRFDEIANDTAPFVWWLLGAASALRDGGVIVCFCRWDTAEAFRLAMVWAGLKISGQVVWDRGVHGMGDLNGSPAPRHDTIWIATKGRYTFPGRRPVSVVRHNRVAAEAMRHPNEKPIALMLELVRDYTAENALVVDPFVGSGSTAEAAVKLARRFIGTELSEGYANMARRRIADAANHLFAEGKP
jgi:site-specific DNA-methyltransferase (adenine-specific)